MQHARLVETDDVDGVGNEVRPGRPLLGSPADDREPRCFAQLLQLALELGEGVPVAGHEQQHGELVAECGHAALEDVAAAFDHDAGQVENEARAVVADGADRDELLHGVPARRV